MIYETKNFRFYSTGHDPCLTELAQTSERKRLSIRRRWLGSQEEEIWSPKCDVFLYHNSKEYTQRTGLPPDSPGYTSLKIGLGHVWKRQIDVWAGHPGLLTAVLPHELTHVVLADRFRTWPIPRWADEGIAILAEPAEQKKALQQTLRKALHAGASFSVQDVLLRETIPADPADGSLFYAQSVSLVEYLTNRGSQRDVIRLIELAQQRGYERALHEIFGIAGIGSLETQWRSWAEFGPQQNVPLTPSLAFESRFLEREAPMFDQPLPLPRPPGQNHSARAETSRTVGISDARDDATGTPTTLGHVFWGERGSGSLLPVPEPPPLRRHPGPDKGPHNESFPREPAPRSRQRVPDAHTNTGDARQPERH